MGDAGLITDERLTHIKREKLGKENLATIKVDMSKAYDRLNGISLGKYSQIMSFPPLWVS